MVAGQIGINVRKYLLTVPGVTSLLGTVEEVFTDVLPQRKVVTLPAIVINLRGGEHVRHFTGSSNFSRTLVQVDCWALTRDAADELAEAARQSLESYSGMMGDEEVNTCQAGRVRYDYEEPIDASEDGLYRHSRDYDIWHQTPATTH